MKAGGIPSIGNYRGVSIHDEQPLERVESVVKPAIDRVMAMTSEHGLLTIARDVAEPPEARLLAAAKIAASFEIAAEECKIRPDVDLVKVRAAVAGLAVTRFRHFDFYCSLLDNPEHVRLRAVKRERPIDLPNR